MSEPEMMLTDGLESEEILHQRLRSLSETIQRQLQETERRHREQLESRIHHNTLLSAELSPRTKLLGLSAPVLESSSECKKHSTRPPTQTQQCEREPSFKTTQQKKEEEAEKPFSFQEREKKKQEKLVELQAKKTTVQNVPQSCPKQVKAPAERERCRKSHISTTQQENPDKPKLRISDCTRMEKLGFLYEKPSFQPKINQQVPDFNRLHKALRAEGLKATLSKDLTKCQPFYLRTSALPARQSRMSPEISQIPSQNNMRRSKSCGAIRSLSADTLPTYITDATRKRCMAIRKSMEMRDGKNQESADWARKYQSKSEALRKTVSLHAKSMDPHKSLKEVYDERLQHHRETDRQRTRDYMRHLQDMNARVRERPLLFEQVKQRYAKAQAEQVYKNELRKAGVEERFVEEKGSAFTSSSISSPAKGRKM
ncbi:protein FAM161B isoform 2-T2 [Syngnathus typhle]